MNLHVYAGPMVRIIKTKFDAGEFCYEEFKEAMWVNDEASEEYDFLLPNIDELYARSHHWQHPANPPPPVYPNTTDDVEWFRHAVKPYTDKLPVPFEIVWAILAQYR